MKRVLCATLAYDQITTRGWYGNSIRENVQVSKYLWRYIFLQDELIENSYLYRRDGFIGEYLINSYKQKRITIYKYEIVIFHLKEPYEEETIFADIVYVYKDVKFPFRT